MLVEDVVEYMAFDLSRTEDFRERVKREKELAESRKLSPKQYAETFKRLLGGGNGNS